MRISDWSSDVCSSDLANVAKYSEGERRLPIRVRLPESARTQLDVIRNLQVPTLDGQTTPLISVADIDFQAGPGKIIRYDRERRVAVEADQIGSASCRERGCQYG